MRIGIIAAVAVIGLVCVGDQARAQQAGITPQQLDEMSKQRMQAIGPRDWGVRPPISAVPKEDIRPANQLLVCMSTDPWKPVYSQPRKSAPVLGKTMDYVAVSGRTIEGFVPILFGPGKTGYVPADEVRPFRSTVKPGLSCTVSGVRPNGSAVFAIH